MGLRSCAIQTMFHEEKGRCGTWLWPVYTPIQRRCCGCNNLFDWDDRKGAQDCAQACAKMINEGKKYSEYGSKDISGE